MSQIGTRFTCLLDNERDIEAVLSGTPGSRQLRAVLARLENKQQALVFGHALPLPVVIRVREYGAELYESVGRNGRSSQPGITAAEQLQRDLDDLF